MDYGQEMNLDKISFKILILILFFFTNSFSLEFRIKDWSQSQWTSNDKFVHCAGGFILNYQIDKQTTWFKSFLIGQAASLTWEIKDGFVKFEDIGFWGGNGFDLKDHIAFTVGQLGQGLLDHVLSKKTIYSNKELKIILKKRLNKKLYIQR